MPNWCNNVLTVLNDKVNLNKKLKPFLDESGGIDFQKIKPCPESYYNDDRWYGWCVSNWGTKWSAGDCSFSNDGRSVSFNTAWSPPLQIVDELSKILECDLRLVYSEPGMDIHGEYKSFVDGNTEDNCHSYENLPHDLKNELEEIFCISDNYNEVEE